MKTRVEKGKEKIFLGQTWVRRGEARNLLTLNNYSGYKGDNYDLVGKSTIHIPTEEELRRDYEPVMLSLDECY